MVGRALHKLFVSELDEKLSKLRVQVNNAAARVGSHAPQQSGQQRLQGQFGSG